MASNLVLIASGPYSASLVSPEACLIDAVTCKLPKKIDVASPVEDHPTGPTVVSSRRLPEACTAKEEHKHGNVLLPTPIQAAVQIYFGLVTHGALDLAAWAAIGKNERCSPVRALQSLLSNWQLPESFPEIYITSCCRLVRIPVARVDSFESTQSRALGYNRDLVTTRAIVDVVAPDPAERSTAANLRDCLLYTSPSPRD